MDFANHLSPELIRPALPGRDWPGLWTSLAGAVEADPLYQQQGPAGRSSEPGPAPTPRRLPLYLAPGGALLHDRRPDVRGIVFALAHLAPPLPLANGDTHAIEIVLYILSGPDRANWALKTAGHFRRLLHDGVLAQRLARESPKAVHRWLAGLQLRLDEPVFARDIMRPPMFEVFPDTPVPEVTLLMEKHRSNAVAVVDHEHRILGEITSNRLFKLGIPEFFERLASVSFIREFDPFERYYAQTGSALARDVMTTDFTVVAEDATIMEIVFTLTVQNHRKVYVVRDGRRVGVIDRVEIINKVLNF